MYLYCVGSGSPTVVLEPGLGETSAVMGWIAPTVARDTRERERDRKMNTQPDDVPPADIPRYTWLLCRYPNLLDGSRLTEPAHRNGSSFKGIQTALLEILGMIKAHSAEYRRQGEQA